MKQFILLICGLSLLLQAHASDVTGKLNKEQKELNSDLLMAGISEKPEEIIKAAEALYNGLEKTRPSHLEFASKAVFALAASYRETNQIDKIEPRLKRFEADYGKMKSFADEAAPSIRGYRTFLGAPKSGEMMPDFDIIPLSGPKLKLSSLRGKVVIVDFWEPWCEPCLAQLPELQRLYQKFQKSGLEIVSSASFNKKQIQDFARTNRIKWIEHFDAGGELLIRFNTKLVPKWFLIDRDGKIIAVNPALSSVEENLPELLAQDKKR